MDYTRIGPYLIAALAVFVVYRRLRRSFGRQALSRTRMRIRIGVLAVIGCLLLPLSLKSGEFLTALIAGGAAGIALAIWGANRTRFETVGGVLYYVPHTYTGIAVSLLFIGRLVYRLVGIYMHAQPAAGAASGTAAGFSSTSMGSSPVTLGLLYVVVGYYVCYYGLVLWKSKHIKPEDAETPATGDRAPG
jgi:hypothetical protein